MSDASVGEVIFKPITQRKADLTNGVVVGAKSGSWEPRSAKPRATGLLVLSPKMREAAETALAQRQLKADHAVPRFARPPHE